ncbi:Bug family tripartite tricarboxylate transporter substrate binding protein [Ramlibacter rhizophilus]|uniref:Tripartite tricarboxylate transporter substrate binding protein n=1 Tax=Ramlibacter rhizophilus TaxID=1781167 RepID=A0A4Z0BKK5_9BURK|nr:tripartite tricarboxylate transporter substrate binding protein [Ramlibacter rhizophilus]TFY98624.1 tripartite tricarboxylate transporter substrate binding protein [Ramlibacter rhizophilus]
MSRSRRLLPAAAALMLLAATGASAQDYPSKPIVLIVPFAPGGFVHAVALMLSEGMSKTLGQSVVVTNQPGANGIVAANAVAKAAPDGYTIFLPTASILTVNPHLYKNVQYDPHTDFAPIGQIVNTSNMFVVKSESGIKSFKDLVERARARPEAVSYGSSGAGSVQHLAGEALQQQGKVKLMHVPYKGIAPALTDVVGGNLTVVFSDASAIPHVKAGKLTAIAVSPKRLDDLPGVPSLAEAAAEAGLSGYQAPTLWYGLVAPKGTPPEVIAKLNAAMSETIKRPDVRQKMTAAGATPSEDTSSQFFASTIKADHERYGKLIKDLNIKVE